MTGHWPSLRRRSPNYWSWPWTHPALCSPPWYSVHPWPGVHWSHLSSGTLSAVLPTLLPPPHPDYRSRWCNFLSSSNLNLVDRSQSTGVRVKPSKAYFLRHFTDVASLLRLWWYIELSSSVRSCLHLHCHNDCIKQNLPYVRKNQLLNYTSNNCSWAVFSKIYWL